MSRPLLRRQAGIQPNVAAVVYTVGPVLPEKTQYRYWTFADLERRSDELARGLTRIGIGRGVRTILMVTPSPDFFALIFAMFKAGAVPVVVDPGMGIGRMLRCLKEARPEAFIGIPKAHVLRTLAPGYFRGVRIWVTVGRRLFWGGHTLDQLRAASAEPFPMAETASDEIAAILFTTGSTGPARGAIYTHGIFGAQIERIRDRFQIRPGEIDLPTFPLFALFDPALGMTAVIPVMDPTTPAQVDPTHIIQPILDHGITNMFASPALLNRVGRYGRERGIKLPSLRRVISAGAPVAPANIEQFSAMLDPEAEIHTPYGATEAVPILTIGSREILSETRTLSEAGAGMCVGRPLNGLEVRIIRITDEPIPAWSDDLFVRPGDAGEIVVKGDLVTQGYFERPEADALAKIRDGAVFRHRMGDIGRQDEKGRIWFLGRKSHRVSTPSGDLFTIPYEAIFNNHPEVNRSALVGLGQRPNQKPVMIIEPAGRLDRKQKDRLRAELLELARKHDLTRSIDAILFHPSFPVDIRHNAKIFREKLAVWAERTLARRS